MTTIIAANDNVPLSGGATPLGTRLARAGRADDLRRYVEYGRVPVTPTWLSADGNLPEGNKPQADRVVETRPAPRELMTVAAKDAIAVRGGMGPINRDEHTAAVMRGIKCDARGHVVEWRGSDNRWHGAAELFRQPKGKRRKTDEEHQADNAKHLAIPATGKFPERSRYTERGSEGEDYRRLRAAHWAQSLCACNDNRRCEIDRLGIGSRYPFDAARIKASLPGAERLPTGVARGAEFLAYRIHSNPRAMQGGVEGGHDLVERQIVETIDAPRIDAALGEHGRVLDLSIAGLTAKEIAVKLGLGDTRHAERKAIAAQDAALAALAATEERLAA